MLRTLAAHIRDQWMGALALFIALTTGGAYAASLIDSDDIARNAVLSKHIKRASVKSSDIKANAVSSSKVADGSLLGSDFAAGQIPTGAPGPQGVPGEPGADGSPDTPQQVLDKLKTLDTDTSGLNADTLDGLQGSAFVRGSAVLGRPPGFATGTSGTVVTTPLGSVTGTCSGAGLLSLKFNTSRPNTTVLVDDGGADPTREFFAFPGATAGTSPKGNDHVTYFVHDPGPGGNQGPKWQIEVWVFGGSPAFCHVAAFATSFASS